MKHPKDMTGLEFLQAMINQEIPRASISLTIPMDLYEIQQGVAKFHVEADERHLNPLGGVHGGFAATVLDSATGCAVHTMLEVGVGYGTIDLNVKMCRPIPMGKKLSADGKVINMSKNLAISEAAIVDEAGKIYAYATATCMLIRP